MLCLEVLVSSDSRASHKLCIMQTGHVDKTGNSPWVRHQWYCKGLSRSFSEAHRSEHQWHALQEEVSGASNLVDQLQAALQEAQASNSNSSAELVAGLQAELERQAGVIGELRTQLRASTEAQEDLRRQTVSLVEAQAHMAQQNVVEGPPAGVAFMQAHLLEKVNALPLLLYACSALLRYPLVPSNLCFGTCCYSAPKQIPG